MHRSLERLAVVAGLSVLIASGAFAAPLSRAALRSELAQRYRAALAKPGLLASAPARYDFVAGRAAIDSFLQAMPLSPLEFLKQDMEARRYEVAIPRFLAQAHQRWIELHAVEARSLYGDAEVDALMQGRQVDAGPPPTATVIGEAAAVGTNRNVAATDVPAPNGFDGEVQIAVNPSNVNQMVASANTWGSAGAACDNKETLSVFYSADGGTTWSYTCAPSNNVMGLGTCSGTVFGSDPALFWNDNNEVFLNYMLICYTGGYKYAMVVARSADGGASWSKQGIVKNGWPAGTLEDKNFYAIDNTPASPYHGRHYTCWDRSNNEKIAYSSNNGATWTEVDLPTAQVGTYDLACEIAVGRNGTVHVVFDTLTCPSNCTDEQMFYTRSTNGGASWSTPVLVRNFNLAGFSNANYPGAQDDRGINPFGAIDIDNSGGACDGNLYATFSDFASGTVADNDVWLSRSTDNGATWSLAPLRINDGGLAGRTQFHPFLQVDQSTGNVVVAWHDTRNDPNNRKVDFYAARSTDCGVSFEANVRVSAASSEFNNNAISTSDESSADNLYYNPNQYGEYLGLDVEAGKAYVAWTDTRPYFPNSTSNPQDENVGFAVVDFGGGAAAVCGNSTIESPEVCDGSALGGQTCVSKGFTGGTLACNGTCTAFDTSACTGAGPVCGNNVLESPEVCDGSALGGQTCVSKGFTGGALACNGSCTAFDTSACTTITSVTQTFTSAAAEDGWVQEKNATANIGGAVTAKDTSSSAIRAGDDVMDRQLKGFVSFDTSSIPDGATVTGVTLRLKRGKVQGTNPFSLLGAMSADVASAFGGNAALASGDFQAAATVSAVCTLSNAAANGIWSTCTFNAAGRGAINKTGRTQVRLAFAKDDNNDLGADWIGYYSGDNATAANRPQLVVTYQ